MIDKPDPKTKDSWENGNGFATAQELQYSDWDLCTIFFPSFLMMIIIDYVRAGVLRLGYFGRTSRFNHKLPISIVP